MGLFNRVIMEIVRRPFRTISLASMIFVLSMMSIVGNFLSDVVIAYFEEYIRIDGYSIFVGAKQGVSEEVINQILNLDHVVGYNNADDLSEQYIPINFKNIPYQMDSVYTQMSVSQNITLIGNIDTNLYQSFRNDEMVLVEGTYPDYLHQGVVIDQILAESNHLQVGSFIELLNTETNEVVSFPIIGVYQTLRPPEVEFYTDQGIYYSISPTSYIFTDYNSYNEISTYHSSNISINIFIDEYKNLEKLYEEIEIIVNDTEGYQVVNCLENSLSDNLSIMVVLKNTSIYFIGFIFIISLIILFLMTLLWMRDHYYEAGVYIALGIARIKVVTYFVLEILLITCVTLIVSLSLGGWITFTYADQLYNLALSFTQSYSSHSILDINVLQNAFSLYSLVAICLVFLSITIISTLFSSIVIINYNPRELFTSK